MQEARGGRAVLGWLAVAALAASACAGDMPTPDGPAADVFSWDVTPPADASPSDGGPAGDAPGASDVGPPDAPVASDLRPAADSDGPDPCAAWSAWTCELDPVLLCRATCAAGPEQLSCINSGSCVCGVSMGPCGTFSAPDPCDVCRQAVEAGCCNE